jgi:hypothetical protein
MGGWKHWRHPDAVMLEALPRTLGRGGVSISCNPHGRGCLGCGIRETRSETLVLGPSDSHRTTAWKLGELAWRNGLSGNHLLPKHFELPNAIDV